MDDVLSRSAVRFGAALPMLVCTLVFFRFATGASFQETHSRRRRTGTTSVAEVGLPNRETQLESIGRTQETLPSPPEGLPAEVCFAST